MALYATLIYSRDVDWSQEEHADTTAEYSAFGAAAAAVIRGGAALYPTSTSTSVRVAGGKGGDVVASDGPYTETKEALTGFYRTGSQTGLDGYSRSALARVWKAERFSWWFTNLMHRFPDTDSFTRKMQIAELDYLRRSQRGAAALAENYVGLPF